MRMEMTRPATRIELAEKVDELVKKLEKQDKMIDLMANELGENLQTCPYDKYDEYLDCENRCTVETEIYKKCWKEYFRRKVENEK